MPNVPIRPELEDAFAGWTADEIREYAYIKAEEELDHLLTELRVLRTVHQGAEKKLERRITRQKAVMRRIAESAPTRRTNDD